MAAVVAGTPTVAAVTSGVSITIAKPSGVVDGDLLVFMVRSQSSNSTVDFSLSGWTRRGPAFMASNVIARNMGIFTKGVPTAASETATDYTFTTDGTASRIAGIMFIVRGANLANIVQVASPDYFTTTVTNGSRLPSLTATGNGLLVAFAGNEVVSPNSSTPTYQSGVTALPIAPSSAGTGASRTVVAAYTKAVTAGATGNFDTVWASSSSASSHGIIINEAAGNSAPTAAYTHSETYLYMTVDGTTSTDSDGTITAYDWDWGDGTSHGSGSTSNHTYAAAGTYTVVLTVTDNGGATDTESKSISVTEAPKLLIGDNAIARRYIGDALVTAVYRGDTLVQRFGYTVTDFIADNPTYIAHRGLGTSYSEQSMAGYDAAVAAGFKCLEVSVRASSDGVFVASHDATTSRVFTTNYTVASTPWSTLSALNSATGPILRLEDILDKYATTHVIFIDIKSNELSLGGYDTAMLNILDNYPNPTSHFVWKGFRGWTPSAATWTAAGYKSWGIYYDAEIGTTGSPHSSVAYFDWLGLNWDAAQTNWDVAIATGKRTFAHVISSDSNRTTGLGKGATGFMITDINAMP